jgi:hypothetical protein
MTPPFTDTLELAKLYSSQNDYIGGREMRMDITEYVKGCAKLSASQGQHMTNQSTSTTNIPQTRSYAVRNNCT